MNLKSTVLGAVLALGLAVSAQAQDDLLTAANVDEILNIARGYGEANLESTSSGDPKIVGVIDGASYQVYFRNCTDNTNCEDLNFYAGFYTSSLTAPLDYEKVNEWNVSKRFSRAYLDGDSDPVVEMDIDLVYGVTPDYMDSTFNLWRQVLAAYVDYIGYTPQG